MYFGNVFAFVTCLWAYNLFGSEEIMETIFLLLLYVFFLFSCHKLSAEMNKPHKILLQEPESVATIAINFSMAKKVTFALGFFCSFSVTDFFWHSLTGFKSIATVVVLSFLSLIARHLAINSGEWNANKRRIL